MGPRQRMAHDGETDEARVAAHPRPQFLLRQPLGGGGSVERGEPVADRPVRPAGDRHREERTARRDEEGRHRRAARGREVDRSRWAEGVARGEVGAHLLGVGDLLLHRAGVLPLQPSGQAVEPPLRPEERAETVQHLEIADLLVGDAERGLPRHPQPPLDALAEDPLPLDQRVEVAGDEGHLLRPRRARLDQAPLPGPGRDGQRDVALQRIAREQHLGDARIVQDRVQHARIVVVEEAEPVHPRLRDDAGEQRRGVGRPRRHVDPEELGAVVGAEEHRVEDLPVAGEARHRAERLLEVVRAGAHLGEEDEGVEPTAHRSRPSPAASCPRCAASAGSRGCRSCRASAADRASGAVRGR